MRALIIDDDPASQTLLRQALTPHAQVTVALTVASGLEAFRESLEQNSPFAVVFLDIVLPDVNGHQALLRLKSLEDELALEDMRALCIVASEVCDPKNVNRAFFEGGAVSYLTKPLTVEQVRVELAKFGLIGCA